MDQGKGQNSTYHVSGGIKICCNTSTTRKQENFKTDTANMDEYNLLERVIFSLLLVSLYGHPHGWFDLALDEHLAPWNPWAGDHLGLLSRL